MRARDLRVVVVGGSIAGLTAGLLLRDLGCDVTVYERSRTRLGSSGAGIVVHPTTVRYLLERCGRGINDVATPATWERYVDEHGDVLHEDPCRFHFTSYSALHRELLRAMDGDRYALASEVVGIEVEAEHAMVALADGRRDRCDLVVCADGIHSLGRRLLLPGVAPEYAGYVGWRGTVRAGTLSRSAHGRLSNAITYHVMPNSHILAYPIPVAGGAHDPSDALTNWVWYRNVAAGPELADLMTDRLGRQQSLSMPAGLVREPHARAVREAAAALPAPLDEMVTRTPTPFVQAICDVDPPLMAFGRACLIGDAAFVVRPHAAAGTAKAADDAWTLVDAIAAARSASQLDDALREWGRARVALGRRVLQRTRETGAELQFSSDWRAGDALPFGLHAPGDSATVHRTSPL
jgi:2,6-dihydroxypyridine 3-monooxygenase